MHGNGSICTFLGERKHRPNCRLSNAPFRFDPPIVKIELEDAAAPLARLLGHSVAAAVGFCALAAISIIPLEVLRLLSQIGISELVQPLRVLEQTLLFADVCLFAVIFVSAIAVFAADTLGAARRRIQAALRESDHD
jgi:hypothetical protein